MPFDLGKVGTTLTTKNSIILTVEHNTNITQNWLKKKKAQKTETERQHYKEQNTRFFFKIEDHGKCHISVYLLDSLLEYLRLKA